MSKLNAVLDLDNTLICSLTMSEINDHQVSSKLRYKDMEEYYRVFARPYLETFLTFLFANFDVSVWTAASRSYMMFIIDNFILTKPNRKLKMALHDKNCDQSRQLFNKKTPKDLRYLFEFKSQNFHACNTFIIDDLAHVKLAQPTMVIQCPYFDVTQLGAHKDRFLKNIIEVLRYLIKLYRETHCAH